jgi:hypothetical protein
VVDNAVQTRWSAPGKKNCPPGEPASRASWGCGLVCGAPRDDYGERRKASMTEPHAIPIIHRTVAITFAAVDLLGERPDGRVAVK